MTPALRFGGLFIPARLMCAPGLNIADRALLALLECLTRRGQGCSATDAEIADLFGIGPKVVARTLAGLEERDLIIIDPQPTRVIRLTRSGARYWLPDIEEGDDECSSTSPRGTSTEGPGSAVDAPSPSPSEAPAGPSSPSASKRESHRREIRSQDEEIRKEIARLKTTTTRIWSLFILVKQNGRDAAWIRAWIDYASRHAENPRGYAMRMIEGNCDLPQTITRAERIDASYEAEYQRTQQSLSLDGYTHASEVSDPEGEAALSAVHERLKHEIGDLAKKKSMPD